MNREYLNDVQDILKNGMSAEEVQAYFDEISRANSKKAKEFLKITSIGISRAKKKVMKNAIEQNTAIYQSQQNLQNQPVQQKGYQYQYFKQ